MDPKTLGQAIGDVETAQTALQTADAAKAAADAKFEAAQAAKGAADTADGDAVMGFNASLDGLIAAATAAKVVRQ